MYKAVLVIPDVYNRSHLKELMTLLLIKMGFGSCFLVQVGFWLNEHAIHLLNDIIFLRIMWPQLLELA